MKLDLNMYQTLGIAVIMLMTGAWLRKKIHILEVFCIPSPVVGGLLYAILMCALHVGGVLELAYDDTLKNVCMVIFFTSIGFQANVKVLRQGGVSFFIFLGIVIALVFAQNGVALGIAKMIDVDPSLGLATGSIPMVGGHGTAGAFGSILEDFGLEGATSLCTAAATFGLVAGSLMGGPIGQRLIRRHDLLNTGKDPDTTSLVNEEIKHQRQPGMYANAAYQLAIAMGIGTVISWLLSLTGMTFPIYIGSMIVAAFMRNFSEMTGRGSIRMGEINELGGICLSLFLGIAMITLELWQLASLALPLIILLVGQLILMFIFAYVVVFNLMGRDYDAAVLAAGVCGFGMGATPNAMANMQAITDKYKPSVKAYILVPMVGSMFADFVNSLVITLFINFIQ